MCPPSPLLLLLALLLSSLPTSASPTHPQPRQSPPPGLLLPLSHIPSSRTSPDPATQAAWAQSAGLSLLAKYSSALAPSISRRLETNLSLLNSNHDGSYSALLTLGTPPTPLNVLLDTGSADFWVASLGCQTSGSGCASLPLWDPKGSETYENASVEFYVGYGSGHARGVMGWDTVGVGGFEVVHQAVALCSEVSPNLLTSPLSGLLGLGFQPLSSSGATPLWQTLANAGLLSTPVMGFYLTRFLNSSALSPLQPGGEFTLGYLDETMYEGPIDYSPIPPGRASYWLLELAELAVAGSPIPLSASSSANAAVIDTGTTLLLAPAAALVQIFALIPGSKPATGEYAGYWEYPCSSNTSLSLRFGGSQTAWPISAADFQLLRLPNTPDSCIAALYQSNLGNGAPQWVVGDTFLKNVYSVFSYDPPRVGFARLSEKALQGSKVLQGGELPSGTVQRVEVTVTAPAERLSGGSRSRGQMPGLGLILGGLGLGLGLGLGMMGVWV